MESSPGQARSERADAIRRLLFEARHGVLSTIGTRPAGFPYGSLVPFAQASHGEPLLLLSGLAQHTRNLRSDPRTCLLVAAPGAPGDDPQQAPRVSLIGTALEIGGAEAEDGRARFLQRHPRAGALLSLDFTLWRLGVTEARYVGGFAQAAWVPGAELLQG